MPDDFPTVTVELAVSDIRLLYSLCAGTVQIPGSKRKFGKIQFQHLITLRDAFRNYLDEFEEGEF